MSNLLLPLTKIERARLLEAMNDMNRSRQVGEKLEREAQSMVYRRNNRMLPLMVTRRMPCPPRPITAWTICGG
jgi:hypothetical protein